MVEVICNFSAIVLAGGKSSRFGSPKAFAKLGHLTMIERVLGALQPHFHEILVASKNSDAFAGLPMRAVRDLGEGMEGPLVGLYAGLRESRSEYNFVTACDMPFLSGDLIRNFCRQAATFNGPGWLVWRDQVQPLFGVYPSNILGLVQRLMEQGERGLRVIEEVTPVLRVTWESLSPSDPYARTCLDIDTPEEFRSACEWVQQQSGSLHA